jgi:hypothetical protein
MFLKSFNKYYLQDNRSGAFGQVVGLGDLCAFA